MNLRPWLLFACIAATPSFACSTFVLQDAGDMIIGHHLDERGYVPGLVVINRRSTARVGVAWDELITGRKPANKVSWTSRWGSITFNVWGIGYPDGGLNERGLYIQEMSLAGSTPPKAKDRPALFAPAWMQYVLDNHESVDEVIASASAFVVDGMEWHYLIADRSGRRASIEFIDGKVVVHEDAGMPGPLVCNDEYAKELSAWQDIARSGASDKRSKLDRFSRGALTIESTASQGASVERAVTVLHTLEEPDTQWTYLFEPGQQRVRYRTQTAPQWRELSWSSIDFANGPTLAWSIDESNGRQWMKEATPQLARDSAAKAVNMFLVLIGPQKLESYLQSLGGSSKIMREQLADVSRWQH
jgi:Linear amide C-N hydrolases, choloylglycine hydrolase family